MSELSTSDAVASLSSASVRAHALACQLMGVDFLPLPATLLNKSRAMKTAPMAEPPSAPNRAAAPSPAPAANTASVSKPVTPARPVTSASESFLPRAVATAANEGSASASRVESPAPRPAQPSLIEVKPDEASLLGDPMGPQSPQPLKKLERDQAAAWLVRLRERYERDAPHQHFVTDHHTIVFGEGDPGARLMFVGEAPGAEEDRTGRPFVGRAGQFLDKMITAMGLKREEVYIANVLKTRPPNNATPTFEEAAACAPYLYEQIAIIRPEVIVTLGLPATRLLLNTTNSMSNLRGRWSSVVIPANLPHPETRPSPGEWAGERAGEGAGAGAAPAVSVMPTFHPAFVLRAYTPENRKKVWSDLLMVVERLGLKRPGTSPADESR